MTEETTTPLLVVCTGVTILQGDKPGIGYHFLNDDGTLGRTAYFDRKSKVMGGGTPGSVYEVRLYPDSQQVGGPKVWKRGWDDAAQVLTWKAEHDMILSRERAAKGQKAGEKAALDEALATLEPLRHLYHKTDGTGRAILMAHIMSYIQRNPMYDGMRAERR